MIRRLEWILAAVLAAAIAVAVLWRPGPRPGEVELSIVSVRERRPQPGWSQQVEVTVRWHWRRPAQTKHLHDLLVVSVDRRYWMVRVPSQWIGPTDDLPRLGVSGARSAYEVTAGQDGELTLVLAAEDHAYHADTLPLEIHWVHTGEIQPGPPNRSWAKSTGGRYPIDPP